jgi:hypothetical protein
MNGPRTGHTRVKFRAYAADMREVMSKPSTLDQIAEDFAEAVAAGDFEAAEGWIATALLASQRS